jgi:hypothetical protein
MVERAYVWFAGQNLLVFVGLAFALLSVACDAGFRFGGRRARRQPNREHEREGAALCRKRVPPARRGKGPPTTLSRRDPHLLLSIAGTLTLQNAIILGKRRRRG